MKGRGTAIRFMLAISYSLTIPIAATAFDALLNLADSGELSWDGWHYMVPAGLLIGCLAMIIEEWLYRYRGLWPKNPTLFLIRSIVLHTVYITLAIAVGHTFLGHQFSSRSLTEASEWLWISKAFPFLLVLTAPIGLLLGVANALLLRMRDHNTPRLFHRSAVILAVLASLVLAPPVESWWIKTRTLSRVRQSLNHLPTPPGSKRVHTEYRGCILCLESEATVVYATDLSPREVCDFYQVHVPPGLYVPRDEACRPYGSGFYRFRAWRSGSNSDPHEEGFVLDIHESTSDTELGNLSDYGRKEVFPQARRAGRTIYSLWVWYREDGSLSVSRKCPCDSRVTWFLWSLHD